MIARGSLRAGHMAHRGVAALLGIAQACAVVVAHRRLNAAAAPTALAAGLAVLVVLAAAVGRHGLRGGTRARLSVEACKRGGAWRAAAGRQQGGRRGGTVAA